MSAQMNFLFATFEGGGSVGPMMTVARRLAERGHSVRVMSDACNRSDAEAINARFIGWSRAPSKPRRSREFDTWDDWSHENPQDGFASLMDNLLVGPALAFAQDLIDELRREPADLVVSSEMLFGPALGCEAIGQRHALLSASIAVFPMPGFLPLGPGLTPPRSEEEKAIAAAITADAEHMLDAFLPALNAARGALGLRPLARLMDQHDAAEAILLGTSRSFDFAPETLPPRVSYIGPQLDEPCWAAPWVDPFAPHDARPLALVGFSTTFQNHAGVLQNVIEAIAPLPMRAVVTLGGSIEAGELRGAENVAIVESAPHHAVLRQARLAVTHGGHGTIMKALAAGVPLLIMPHGRDQADNGVRVAARGAGLALDRTSDVATIRAALSRLLEEPEFAARAQELGKAIARDAAETPVTAMLERFARGGGAGHDAAIMAEAG
mgnify:CR=1 FL=1